MVVSALAGILLALGQHVLYCSLHRKVGGSEDEKIRVVLYGRALAYLSKVAFAGCVTLSYRQRIWRTFRARALSVLSIDRLFLATEDPSLFFSWETISKATLVTVMALVIWLIPVATIVFSPAALTFGDTHESEVKTISVPTLNFSAESFKDWRVPTRMPDGANRPSLMFYNTTDRTATADGWFDYYDTPSTELNRISLMTAYSMRNESLNLDDARQKSCGGDFNCTYTISFVGPAYNCRELAHGDGDDQKVWEMAAPVDTSLLVPRGPYVYYADVDMGEYLRPQPHAGEVTALGGFVKGDISEDFGSFKSEPILWIGYATNSSETLPPDSPYAQNWTHKFDSHIFACTHYETRYTVEFNYSGPFFTTDITYDYMQPVVDTNFSRLDDGKLNVDDPQPVSNFVSAQTDPPRYKKIAAYRALGERLRYFLRGYIEQQPPIPGPPYPLVHSEIVSTRLVNKNTTTPLGNLAELVQDFYADMILSLLSTPHMLVVSEESVPVSRSRFKSTFIYNPWKLWVCYAPVILLTLVFLLVGAWTIIEDGTTFSVGFSRILVTTRNTTLDEISRGACLGNDPFPTELMHTRLKFGVLDEMGFEHEYAGTEGLQSTRHCTFGVPSELTPIQKGVPYAGLQRRREHMRMQKEKME